MGKPLTALIVDDEPLARQELLYLLGAAEDVEVLAQGSNGIEAVDLIRTCKPDVVFLDVRMPGLDGFAVLKKLLAVDKKFKMPHVVFATAFDQYAVKAFEVNAVDYLLKPFDAKRVARTIEKVRARVEAENDAAPDGAAATGGEAQQGIKGMVAGAQAKLDALLEDAGRTGDRRRCIGHSERCCDALRQGSSTCAKPADARRPKRCVLCDYR